MKIPLACKLLFFFSETFDLTVVSNLQMQENYGAAGYFLEVESKNKKQQSSYVLFSLLILVLIPWFEVWVI